MNMNNIENNMVQQIANKLYKQNSPATIIPDKLLEPFYYFLPNDQQSTSTDPSKTSHIQPFNSASIRKDFPILNQRINGKPLVWLDSSATTQKPTCVIDALDHYYRKINSNVHRGAHTLATYATNAYESARKKVQQFIGASSSDEIIFVRGATEAINLVAQTYGASRLRPGDEILLTMMEHHSNIVPWQLLEHSHGIVIKPIPINNAGEIIMEEYIKLFTPRTKLVALTHVSNVLGTINPVGTMTKIAHSHGAHVLIDGAQSVPHLSINVKELDADFYVFSGHKLYAPTGIGVLYGKKYLLERMPPWQRGGGMIKNVSYEKSTYNKIPNKFEAGTGNIAGAVGLGAAIDYVQTIGMANIEQHEKELTRYAMNSLSKIPGLHLIGTSKNKTSVLSFIIDGITPENIAKSLDKEGIAVRSGHHCSQPTLQRFGLTNTVRASLGIYNTKKDIDRLVNGLKKIAPKQNPLTS